MTYYLTFDVEDWFHAHNVLPAIKPDQWDDYEPRVERNVNRLLDLLAEYDTRATFFVLGWVADRHPTVVELIEAAGHDVESHGYNHKLLYEQNAEAVRRDLARSKNVLESIVDQSVTGYRAPSFSITPWAADILADLGFEYDSSRYAARHDRYGSVSVTEETTFTTLENGLTEIQLPTLEVGPMSIPWGGGGYFRFIPYRLFRRGLRRIGRDRDVVFYLHPWELDPHQPHQQLPRTNRLRHYHNLSETAGRLRRLLADFDWEPISTSMDGNH
ncbi:XrtA system polysaccharide deacetylase [Halomicrobium katesii]|uniref:XrtA system polysaccharide deacetylase n=1 Tax=Halomicrobium katesii TaxID=437163 RepID=UPI00036B9BDA|nr:XrtA system polysaccharide deacetylase [Halomicrobium katesii]